jgi:nucleoside-diphosphate-sugar epimerase
MERIVVTGASGFIGKNLIPKLKNYETLCPSRAEMDITKSEEVKRYFEKTGEVDYLIHLASSIPRGTTDNLGYYLINTLGTVNICQNALFDKIIFTSSENVYGENGTFSESDECLPKTHYATSKLLAEKFVEMTKKWYCILRCSSIYGIGDQNQTRLIPNVMKKAVSGETLEIWGSGNGAKDYLYVDDVTEAILASMDSAYGGVYNIGYGDVITKKEIIAEIAKLADVEIRFVDSASWDMKMLMEIRKAEEYLKWKPQISWQKGLKRTYEYWNKQVRRS